MLNISDILFSFETPPSLLRHATSPAGEERDFLPRKQFLLGFLGAIKCSKSTICRGRPRSEVNIIVFVVVCIAPNDMSKKAQLVWHDG